MSQRKTDKSIRGGLPMNRRSRNVPHPSDAPASDFPALRNSNRRRAEVIASRSEYPRSGSPSAGDSGDAPKPPAICALFDDLVEVAEMPEAVFGQYPRGLIARMLPWLRCKRSEILHVCSGSLPPGEGIRVDVRTAARPDILADGRALPLADGSVAAVMLDPPYTKEYARDLYGVEYPRPSHLLREAARVVRPGGAVVLVHYLVAVPPLGCGLTHEVTKGLSTGYGFPMRAVTVYRKEQENLL